jgi:hypothetical protein
MKKLAILFIFIFAAATISSCKSAKGCGLTGKTEVQNSNTIEVITLNAYAVA